MPRARKHLVCLSDTPYYLITSRCVRRAFLCGEDKLTGRSYEHRRRWVEDRIRVLSSLFCIDLCAYAVMSNHYHLVVKISPNQADEWSDSEVLMRWTSLFKGPILIQQARCREALTDVEMETVRKMIAVYRSRLQSLSWFMKCLNEPIARKANAEDDCKGHFWEARFHSEPLCSEQALIAAMAYVDLNPIRAKMATTPETSTYTSIKARIEETGRDDEIGQSVSKLLDSNELNHFNSTIKSLLGFAEPEPQLNIEQRHTQIVSIDEIPIYQSEYLSLVDVTGRVVALGKRGYIDPELKPILDRLALSNDQWIQVSAGFRQYYRNGHLRIKKAA